MYGKDIYLPTNYSMLLERILQKKKNSNQFYVVEWNSVKPQINLLKIYGKCQWKSYKCWFFLVLICRVETLLGASLFVGPDSGNTGYSL